MSWECPVPSGFSAYNYVGWNLPPMTPLRGLPGSIRQGRRCGQNQSRLSQFVSFAIQCPGAISAVTPMSNPGEITQLLRLAQAGDRSAESKLLELLYGDLRRLAAAYLKRERRDHTLQPTALLHEAYLRLLGQNHREWKSRSHFLAAAAQAMRHVLVDWARAHSAKKRGGLMKKVELDAAKVSSEIWPEQILDLDAALRQLSEHHPRYARVVELRFFGGLTDEEIAEVLGVSDRTVGRDWEFARAWLEGVLHQPAPTKTRRKTAKS